MSELKTFQYKGYELLCKARRMDDDKFVPVLVVARHDWPRRPREIEVKDGPYTSEMEAIDAARKKGVEWIHDYG